MAIVTRHPIRTDVMNLREGEISISYPETITPDDYDDIAVWLDLFQNRIRRRARSNQPSDPPPGDESDIHDMSIKIATEIEWYDPIMVPGEDRCDVLCAIKTSHGGKVISAHWSASLGQFFVMTGSSWRRIDPERWACMPDFPEEP